MRKNANSFPLLCPCRLVIHVPFTAVRGFLKCYAVGLCQRYCSSTENKHKDVVYHGTALLEVDVDDRFSCNKCHNNIPVVTDTFNESTLVHMELSSETEDIDASVFVVVSVDIVANAGGIRTYSVHDFATSARSP